MFKILQENDWDVGQVIGKGSFGLVYEVTNNKTNDKMAMKEITIRPRTKKADLDNAKKEVAIHQHLRHQNIIQFYGSMLEVRAYYLYIELASGGQLHDKICIGKGVGEDNAKMFYNQILQGVKYLHQLGVAHRDLKPHNILLDIKDQIKIADFGAATLFRNSKGVERTLNTFCGSPSYMAPEIHTKEYRGEPADVWSTGIVLVWLIMGGAPWSYALDSDRRFLRWKLKEPGHPLTKVTGPASDLLNNILNPDPIRRFNIEQILSHIWLTLKGPSAHVFKVPSPKPAAKNENFDLHL